MEPRARDGRSWLVVGLGNPLLGDDAVGWRVLDALEERRRLSTDGGALDGVDLDRLATGGLALMERLVGYARAIVVDAVHGLGGEPGTVSCRPLALVEDGRALHLDGTHDASLRTAIEAGRAMGASLPDEIDLVGVEAASVGTFDERLTPAVEDAVPRAAELVLARLRGEACD